MMETKSFWKSLSIVTLFTLVAMLLLHQLKPFQSLLTFNIACVILFFFLTIFAYFAGKKAALSSNNYRFIQLIILFIFIKMVLSLVLVLGYWNAFQPDTKLFVIPFILVYLIFTIFELYFLENLARVEKESK
jgi:hypothetical protein